LSERWRYGTDEETARELHALEQQESARRARLRAEAEARARERKRAVETAGDPMYGLYNR